MSNSDFDPYRKWLGIPKGKRPPTHYDLLAVGIDEDDLDVIRSAAEQRRTFVEKQRGKGYEEAVTGILYQLDEAEMTLTNPELRREYDQRVKLFGKRRRRRQVDPTGLPPKVGSRPGRTVGEDSGLAGQFGKIVAILALAFFGMAAASFYLPWGKLDERPEKQIANVDSGSVADAKSAVDQPGSSSEASPTTAAAAGSRPDDSMGQVESVADGRLPVDKPSDQPDWTVIRDHTDYVTCLDVTDDGERFVTISHDNTVRLWDFRSGELIWRFDDESPYKEKVSLAVTFAENDSAVLALTRSRFVKLDAQTGELIDMVEPFTPRLDWAVFSPDAARVIVFQNDNGEPLVKLCDTTDSTFKALKTMKEWIPLAAISPDGEIFAGSFEKVENSYIVDPNSTAIKATLETIGGRVAAADFSKSGNLLAIGEGTGRESNGLSSEPPTNIVWKRHNRHWTKLHTLRNLNDWTWSVCFSPDEQFVVFGGSGREDDWYGHLNIPANTLRVVNVATGRIVHEYRSHNGSILDVKFTPDGRHLITVGADTNIRRWDFNTIAGSFSQPVDLRSELISKLAGSHWENTFGGTFEWTKDGRLLHGREKTEREWFAVGPQEIKLVFSGRHVDSFEFDSTFSTFDQYVRDGTKNIATGRRIDPSN